MAWPEPVTLAGRLVTLVPCSPVHVPGLREAAADGEPWRLWYTSVPAPEQVADEVDRRIGLQSAGTWLPFTMLGSASGEALGMTSYLNLVPFVPRLEIGATWLRKSAQRSGVNVEAKLLLLQHAFEGLGCVAVELRTNSFNQQSRRAIEALGAKLDGILRNHHDPAGNVRDTCVYSVIAPEWPAVKRHLQWRLANRASG